MISTNKAFGIFCGRRDLDVYKRQMYDNAAKCSVVEQLRDAQ